MADEEDPNIQVAVPSVITTAAGQTVALVDPTTLYACSQCMSEWTATGRRGGPPPLRLSSLYQHMRDHNQRLGRGEVFRHRATVAVHRNILGEEHQNNAVRFIILLYDIVLYHIILTCLSHHVFYDWPQGAALDQVLKV